MVLKLEQRLLPSTKLGLELHFERMGKAYNIVDYWDSQLKCSFQFDIAGKSHKVEYVLAPESWLNFIAPKEKIGFYLGDMMFITSNRNVLRENWVPYVALKLYSEKFIDDGKDFSGKVRHWESLSRTFRVAGQTMSERDLIDFLDMTRDLESTKYFELDHEVREFLDNGDGNIKSAKLKYLNAHHKNLWVRRGRDNEYLTDLGFNRQGFRNHAEAIVNALRSLGPEYAYLGCIL